MLLSYFGDDRSGPLPWLLPVHHLIGLIAIILTLVTMLPWLLRKRSPQACPGGARYRRLLRRATFGLFFLSVMLGFVIYLTML